MVTLTDIEDDNVTCRRHRHGLRPDPSLGPMPKPPPYPDLSQTPPVYPDLRLLAQTGPIAPPELTATPTVTLLKMQRVNEEQI